MKTFDEIINYLPMSIRGKDAKNTNVAKLIKIVYEQQKILEEEIKKIINLEYSEENSLHLEHLDEYSLERLGNNYSVNNKGYEKERYRRYLLAKINSFMSMGNIESIENLLMVIFDCVKEDFEIYDYTNGNFKLMLTREMSGVEVKENVDLCRAAGIGFVTALYSKGEIRVEVNNYIKEKPIKVIKKYDIKKFLARDMWKVNEGIIAKEYIARDNLILSFTGGI